jgi:hypothetical protein
MIDRGDAARSVERQRLLGEVTEACERLGAAIRFRRGMSKSILSRLFERIKQFFVKCRGIFGRSTGRPDRTFDRSDQRSSNRGPEQTPNYRSGMTELPPDDVSWDSLLGEFRSQVMHKRVAVAPSCFISYAWEGETRDARVDRVSKDLQRAGITVIVDSDHRLSLGTDLVRTIAKLIAGSDFMIVAGSKLYLQKYNNDHETHMLETEVRLGFNRFGGRQEAALLPVLLDGTAETSLPELLLGLVFVDLQGYHYGSGVIDLAARMFKVNRTSRWFKELRRRAQKVQ